MTTHSVKNWGAWLAGAAAIALLSGCATSSQPVASNTSDAAVVFGKLKLVRNGEPVRLGDSMFENSATLNLYETSSKRPYKGRVGNDGEFSWELPAGDYRVESIAFRVHDSIVRPETNFTFSVSDEHDASYLGTIALEASFDSGYLGVVGGVDRFTVWDECESDCARRLAALGVAESQSQRSLLKWDHGND